jgi:signal transduction histidine kinase/ligand-binding sensor domain-containing protein
MQSHSHYFSTAAARYFSILSLLLLASVPSQALDPDIRVSQYAHTAWLVQDGYFNGAPRAITQTTDGYIWIGTQSGLWRFDGLRFFPWTSPDGKHLPSSTIFALLGARDGSLWIGTAAGIAHFVNDKLVEFPDFHDEVTSILEDPSGHIWLTHQSGVERKSPLCEVSGVTIRCLDKSDGVSQVSCCSYPLVRDDSGNFWVGTDQYLFRWKPGSSETFLPGGLSSSLQGLEEVNALALAPDGSLLVGMAWTGKGGGLQRFTQGTWKPVIVPGLDATTLVVLTLLLDRDGGLWVGTKTGIYRIHSGHVDRFGTEEGLSSNSVVGFYEDREGGIWVLTNKGIDKFHRLQVTTFSAREGLTADNVVSVIAGRDDTVWLGSQDGLDSVKDGRVSVVRSGKSLPGHEVTSLFEDHAGQLWVGVDNDLFLYTDGRFHRVRRSDGHSTRFIVGITEDSEHNIWAEVSGSNRELIRIQNLKVVDEYPEAAVPSARQLAADQHSGIWLGLRTGNLARFRDGHTELFSFPHNVDSDVRQVIVSSDGSVLGTTAFGLVAWRNGKTQILTSRNGLPCDGMIGATWDNQGALWLYTDCGLARIDKADVEKWWANSEAIVAPRVFDAFDGVESGTPDYNPAAKSSDGKLWFANHSALQMIDPGHLVRNGMPPPVHVENLIADHKDFFPTQDLRLPPLLHDLEIDYTALSFVNPRQVRFRYKLEGRDPDWQDAGARRQAFYNDLQPGRYRFRVLACNNDGLWNEEGASLRFSIAPAWYQTMLFRVSCVTLALLLAWSFYRFRLRQNAESLSARFDERMAERTRLARDLHDTFLQTLQGSKLVAEDAMDKHSDPAYMRNSLEKLSGWLDRAAREGRAALNSLRTSPLEGNDLASSFQIALEECQGNGLDEGIVTVHGSATAMNPIIAQEIYLIGYEAVRNVLKHSRATRLEVHLTYSHDFTLRVRDNGQGIDPKVAANGKEGHFGLQSMRERAGRIGGQLQLITSTGTGTTIELHVPGKTAFHRKRQVWSSLPARLLRIKQATFKFQKPD